MTLFHSESEARRLISAMTEKAEAQGEQGVWMSPARLIQLAAYDYEGRNQPIEKEWRQPPILAFRFSPVFGRLILALETPIGRKLDLWIGAADVAPGRFRSLSSVAELLSSPWPISENTRNWSRGQDPLTKQAAHAGSFSGRPAQAEIEQKVFNGDKS